MREIIAAMAILFGALTMMSHAAAASKQLRKRFNFQQGSISFYVDKTWKNVRNGKTESGIWEWLDANHVCPVEWTSEKSKKHCRFYYKVK